MSKGQMLKALVSDRLTAAAEEIFVLFERTIAEYEAELCRSKEENQRKQRLLDSFLNPKVLLHKVGAGAKIQSHGAFLNQEITASQIKEESEEQMVIQREFCVKTESSVLQETELREETRGDDIGPELHFLLNTDGGSEHLPFSYIDENWGSLFSSSAAQTETEVNGENCSPDHMSDTAHNSGILPKEKSSQETSTSENNRNMSDSNEEAGKTVSDSERSFLCPVCPKVFDNQITLKRHEKVHTGGRPYSCPMCSKTFCQKGHLEVHIRRHTGEKPFSCLICGKSFYLKTLLDMHVRRHTGEKPYSCPTCKKAFVNRAELNVHVKSHTGEKPFSCAICYKHFATKSYLKTHMRQHTGERPYSCDICNKTFYSSSGHSLHMKRHTEERPYSCAICEKTFKCSTDLRAHERLHSGVHLPCYSEEGLQQ